MGPRKKKTCSRISSFPVDRQQPSLPCREMQAESKLEWGALMKAAIVGLCIHDSRVADSNQKRVG